MVVRGLGGESGVDSDGEAQSGRTEEKAFSVVPRERRKEERDARRDEKNVCQTKMRMNVWPIKFYCLF